MRRGKRYFSQSAVEGWFGKSVVPMVKCNWHFSCALWLDLFSIVRVLLVAKIV